jgi:Domain of unknown function (DUF5666)
MSNFLHSSKTKTVLIILGSIVLLLVVFGFGIAVGYYHAIFASRFGQNYYHNFYGGTPGLAPMNEHGIVGTVIDVSSSSISVSDQGNNEQSVAILGNTVIRDVNNTITVSGIIPGDQVTVIGEPNTEGQIQARFIRVFDASSSLPQPPEPAPPSPSNGD